MKNRVLFILLFISNFCFSQNEKTAELININGTVLFKYIPDSMFEGYYCSLGATLLIDSTEFDFISSNDANYAVIRQNWFLTKELGDPGKYLTGNFESHFCIYKASDTNFVKTSCDSIIKIYAQNNIYDTLLYKPSLSEEMTLEIRSNNVYSKNNSDTIYIAISFIGLGLRYNNIAFGQQTDYRETIIDNEIEFDNSHSTCPFKKLKETFIVLNNVESLRPINEEEIITLDLKHSELKGVKVFLHE